MSDTTSENGKDAKPPLRPVPTDTTDEMPAWQRALFAPGEDIAEAATEPDQSATESDHPTAGEPAWMAALGPEPSATTPDDTETDADDAPHTASRRWVPIVFVAGVVALFAVFVVAIIGQVRGSDDTAEPNEEALPVAVDTPTESAASGPSKQPEPTGAAATPQCVSSRDGDTVTGNGPGDRESLAGVIFAFEHAYYNDRDAAKALELMADDSPISNTQALQEGIDAVPEGTDYCVSVTTKGDTATVELTEVRPGAAPETFVQEITGSSNHGRSSIVDIVEKETEE